MRYYKKNNTYTATLGTVENVEEITQKEYEDHEEDVIRKLDNPDPTDSEVLNILLGGDTE